MIDHKCGPPDALAPSLTSGIYAAVALSTLFYRGYHSSPSVLRKLPLVRGSRSCFVQPSPHFASTGTTRPLEYDVAFAHHYEIRNRLNAKLRCQIGVLLGVHF